MTKTFRLDSQGYEIEVGKYARQAHGAVWFKHGDTVILSTAVTAPSEEFPGFLPLTIEYREQYAAAGKIPGGYIKREGRPSDREVLTCRLIDRAVRPLFPINFFDQVQVINTVYSVDKEHSPNTVALLASSLALTISKIPFLGPVGVVEMGRIDGKWVMSPSHPESLKSDVRLVVAGTEEGLCMVEGSGLEISEKEFVDALFTAHEKIKEQVVWQNKIAQELNATKDEVRDDYGWKNWEERIDTFLTEDRVKSLYVEDKVERYRLLDEIKEAFAEKYAKEIEEKEVPKKVVGYIFASVLNDKITELIFSLKKRVDGRAMDKVRDISVEVGILPFTHGSACFTRGRTQALVTTTLGSGEDEQKFDGIMEAPEGEGAFMLHYNFPPFSTGEARWMRGPGRREIGHGYLARSSIQRLLPDKEKFPYTIRQVSDVLESDGSSSMATVCGSTMSLMQAGVPLKKMVAGIAMGMLRSKSGDFIMLSDINAFEDAFGLMDFKVAGTADGITAIQMDVKYKGGLAREVFEQAMAQAKQGRLHILGEMQKVMTEPNKELSPLVPRVVTVQIDTDKIGAIIGGGGKTIREITETTNTSIDIEESGLVKIFGGPEADLPKAINWVKTLAGQIERGAVYTGKIRRLADFGLFVELVPGLDGLVHVSMIPREKQRTFLQEFKVDDIVKVEVVEYDDATGRVRLKLIN